MPYSISDCIIFVDTETTGIPTDESKDFKAVDNWPTIRQIAWYVFTKEGVPRRSANYSIEHVDMSVEESLVKSDSEYHEKTELPIFEILPKFLNDLSLCDVIIGHNIEYDVKVILCELFRLGLDTRSLESLQQFCTMKNSVDICGFETSMGNRYPKLQELYSKLFHRPFDFPHDAFFDVRATAKCYWKLYQDGFINIDNYPYLIHPRISDQIAKNYVKQAEQTLEKSKSWERKSIYSEACEALGIRPPLSIDNNSEKILNYIRTKYHIKAKDDAALAKLFEDDKKAQENAKIRSYDEPLSLLKKAAELGNAYSMFRIAHLYYYYLDDKRSAIGWYIKAIEHGYVSQDCYFEYANVSTRLYGAQSTDGPKYYNKWAQLCEEGFETISQCHLDLYIEAFEKGKYGQKKDSQKAIELCRRAIEQNRSNFSRIEIIRNGVRRTLAGLLEETGDNKEAVRQYEIYLRELQDIGENYSFDCILLEEKLLKIYFEGIGVDVDYQKARHYIEDLVSERKNSCVAYFYLGQCYENGLADYPIDSYKAFQCYYKACERVPNALKKIGRMYLYGIGCEKNKKQARTYLNMAKNKGIEVSQLLEKANSWF